MEKNTYLVSTISLLSLVLITSVSLNAVAAPHDTKATAEKTTAEKTAAEKTAAEKTAAEKTAAEKAAAEKAAAEKAAAEKANKNGNNNSKPTDDIIPGSTVRWNVTVYGFKKYSPPGLNIQQDTTQYHSPPGATAEVTKVDNGDLILNFSHDGWSIWRPFSSIPFITNIYETDAKDCGVDCVNKKDTYKINKDVAMAYEHSADAYVAGVLVIPFKYHLSDNATTGESTVGGYLGHRWGSDKGALALIGSAGLALLNSQPAQVSSSSTTTSTESTGNATGITAAFGIMGTIASTNTQFGLIAGWDWLSKNSHYQYQGKPWLAFGVGYNFLQ